MENAIKIQLAKSFLINFFICIGYLVGISFYFEIFHLHYDTMEVGISEGLILLIQAFINLIITIIKLFKKNNFGSTLFQFVISIAGIYLACQLYMYLGNKYFDFFI